MCTIVIRSNIIIIICLSCLIFLRFPNRQQKNKINTMNKLLSIVVLLAVAVCSCHCISDHRSIRSTAPEVSADINPITVDAIAPRDSAAAETVDVYNTGNNSVY